MARNVELHLRHGLTRLVAHSEGSKGRLGEMPPKQDAARTECEVSKVQRVECGAPALNVQACAFEAVSLLRVSLHDGVDPPTRCTRR